MPWLTLCRSVKRRQPWRTWGRTASTSTADGARRAPLTLVDRWDDGHTPGGRPLTMPEPRGGSERRDSAMGPTITGVPRPIASATTNSARLSAMPCASLLSELKLQGANSTTPQGGRGRMARSNYDSTTCTPSMSARLRGTITRDAFGVGIAVTVEEPRPTSSRRNSGQRAAVVVPRSTK
jgi:hypothetical protein